MTQRNQLLMVVGLLFSGSVGVLASHYLPKHLYFLFMILCTLAVVAIFHFFAPRKGGGSSEGQSRANEGRRPED